MNNPSNINTDKYAGMSLRQILKETEDYVKCYYFWFYKLTEIPKPSPEVAMWVKTIHITVKDMRDFDLHCEVFGMLSKTFSDFTILIHKDDLFLGIPTFYNPDKPNFYLKIHLSIQGEVTLLDD